MRIALVAPPFIPVPPLRYGGTELFIAHLAAGLTRAGHHVIVYANGESHPDGELRSIYPSGEWPLADPGMAALREFNHTAWACQDAARHADVIHVNSGAGVVFSRFVDTPFVATLHHPCEPELSDLYAHYPHVTYVAISQAQQRQERLPRITTIHHGLDLSSYRLTERKDGYLAFLGRMAPSKGPHLAIEVARRAGLPLKLAGEVQPAFRDYWQTMVAPHVDGRQVEFVGEADLATKNELLGGARALLFPIQWNEPFGLVMIEAMACGTPVLAFDGGSVPEIVRDGISGWICRDVAEMADRVHALDIAPAACRAYVAERFSIAGMALRYEEVYRTAVQRGAAGASSRLRAELPLGPAPVSSPERAAAPLAAVKAHRMPGHLPDCTGTSHS